MDTRPAYRKLGKTAEKWRDLAEQRRDYMRDMYSSGRWRRYYTEDEFLQCLRDVARLCDRWGVIVEQMRSNLLPKVSADRMERRRAA